MEEPLRPFGERGELNEMLAYLGGVFEVGEPSASATVWMVGASSGRRFSQLHVPVVPGFEHLACLRGRTDIITVGRMCIGRSWRVPDPG